MADIGQQQQSNLQPHNIQQRVGVDRCMTVPNAGCCAGVCKGPCARNSWRVSIIDSRSSHLAHTQTHHFNLSALYNQLWHAIYHTVTN